MICLICALLKLGPAGHRPLSLPSREAIRLCSTLAAGPWRTWGGDRQTYRSLRRRREPWKLYRCTCEGGGPERSSTCCMPITVPNYKHDSTYEYSMQTNSMPARCTMQYIRCVQKLSAVVDHYKSYTPRKHARSGYCTARSLQWFMSFDEILLTADTRYHAVPK